LKHFGKEKEEKNECRQMEKNNEIECFPRTEDRRFLFINDPLGIFMFHLLILS